MRRALILAAAASLAFSVAAAQPRAGGAAPDFAVRTAAGERLSLEALSGRTVILEWSDAACPFVAKHYDSGAMQRLQKRITGDGSVWVTVFSPTADGARPPDAEAALRLTETRGAKPTHVVVDADGSLAAAFGAKTAPHVFVLDGEGRLRYQGAVDTIVSTDPADVVRADSYLGSAAEALRTGAQVIVPRTLPYGCPLAGAP